MIYQISDNIISSLGFSTEENYSSVKQGITGLSLYENRYDIPEPFMASLINDEKLNDEFSLINNTKRIYTKFEKAIILSIFKALKQTKINPKDSRLLFIFSTTKGNINLLENHQKFDSNRVHLWRSAQIVCDFFGNQNRPLIISNACISGSVAQITAMRYLEKNSFDYAIVAGGDVVSKFIISGFQSFKALSPNICKPFDQNRIGLNLGEAAATIIYKKVDNNTELPKDAIVLTTGAIANDANHISGPSRTGNGLTNAIEKVMQNINIDDIAFINAHGTATPYNDDMESMAITNAHLQNRPLNSLKGYFGHTLGAAGVLESIISAHALKNNTVLKTYGLENPGTVCPVQPTLNNILCSEKHFIKFVSGFGGGNAALLFTKNS